MISILLLLVPTVGALASGLVPASTSTRSRIINGLLAVELGLSFAAIARPGSATVVFLDLELTLTPGTGLVLAATFAAVLVSTLGLTGRLCQFGGFWLFAGATGTALAIVGSRSLEMSGIALGLSGASAAMLLFHAGTDARGERDDLRSDLPGAESMRLLLWISLAGTLLVLAGAFERLGPGLDRSASTVGLVGAATALALVGIGIGMGALPFFPWSPRLARRAPGAGALIVALVGGGTGGIVLQQLNSSAWRFGSGSAQLGLLLVGGAGAVLAALAALAARDAKRPGVVVAYVAGMNADLILAALALGPPEEPVAIAWLLATQILSASLAFAALAGLGQPQSGAFRRRPLLGISLVVALLGLVGLPPTAGFTGRALIAAAARGSEPGFLVAVTIASILAGVGVLRAFVPLVGPTEVVAEPLDALDLGAALIALALLVGGILPGQVLLLR